MQLHLRKLARSRPQSAPVLARIAVVALLASTTAQAQDTTQEIDKIFDWATSTTPGCACAVAQNGKTIASRGYGSADLERGTPITPDTRFDAGSLQKQFAAASILLLVEEKRVSLSDDIHKYIPELPDYGHKVTIDHLLTHTSGIRDWTGLLPLSREKVDALTAITRQRGLNFVPGEEWSYSNSGYVLAKEVVARVSGMPLSEFSRTRLFEPLGMKSSSYHENMRDIVPNRAIAYQKGKDGYKTAMLIDEERGGGGLLTTANDLIIWNEALAHNRLGKFVTDKLHEPATLNNGRKLEYARGIIVDKQRNVPFYWHSGSADGYKSMLVRFPNENIAIAIMCNSGDGTDRADFAMNIFEMLVPRAEGETDDEPTPPVAAKGVDAAALDLNSRVGLFLREKDGEPLQLAMQGPNLAIAGGPALVAQSQERFKRWGNSTQFMSADEFELHFVSADELEMKSMEGKVTRYRRAQPFSPTAEDLKAIAGRYQSDELGTVFVFEAGESGLVGRVEHHRPERSVQFKPIERDTFQFSRMMLRFQRDKAGKVVGLDYSNPAMRHVQFTRLSDAQKG